MKQCCFALSGGGGGGGGGCGRTVDGNQKSCYHSPVRGW